MPPPWQNSTRSPHARTDELGARQVSARRTRLPALCAARRGPSSGSASGLPSQPPPQTCAPPPPCVAQEHPAPHTRTHSPAGALRHCRRRSSGGGSSMLAQILIEKSGGIWRWGRSLRRILWRAPTRRDPCGRRPHRRRRWPQRPRQVGARAAARAPPAEAKAPQPALPREQAFPAARVAGPRAGRQAGPPG